MVEDKFPNYNDGGKKVPHRVMWAALDAVAKIFLSLESSWSLQFLESEHKVREQNPFPVE